MASALGRECERVLTKWPNADAGRKQFWSCYRGWDLADVILDLVYIRPMERC